MKKKSQSSLELIILMSGILFLFLIFMLAFQQNYAEKARTKRNIAVQDLATEVQNEINFAATSLNGYQRNFSIPNDIINADYNITVIENVIYIQTYDGRHSLALPIQNITGQIAKGQNTIRKINGTIYLN